MSQTAAGGRDNRGLLSLLLPGTVPEERWSLLILPGSQGGIQHKGLQWTGGIGIE